jgi:hypothetical protein
MKKVIENTAYWVGILVLGIVVGVTIKMVGAWVEPGAMPPGGNIAAPLNTSNVGQSKQGGLTLNIGGATYGLIVDKGLVGIKTTTPQAELDVNGDIRAHNLNLNNNLNVGGDATINGNLNVNGTINGGGDGGGPYVAFGTNTCATGWTAAYQGVAMVAIQSWVHGGASGSTTVCKQGGDLPALNHSVGVYWQTSSSHQSTDNMPCAVCVK